MKLFGVVITTRKAIMRERMDNAAQDAQFQLRTLLLDNDHPLRGMIARVARSAAKDYFGDQLEVDRARFEADPRFQEWAAQRREHDLAEAEERKDAALTALDKAEAQEHDVVQLRYGILGLLMAHGAQYTATIADTFDAWTPKQITEALANLVSAELAEVKHGVYSATHAGVGLDYQQKKARNEDPDSQ